MNNTTKKFTPSKQQRAVAKRMAELREELDDLRDYFEILEARARNLHKPTYSVAEVKKKLGIK